jgi:DNA (cytosine-5)-methyltransferase 1
VLAANDSDPDAGATFRVNFPESVFMEGTLASYSGPDFRRLSGLGKRRLDCLLGGPPCQSFSYNNHHRTSNDSRARLFRDYLRVVRELKPRFIVMENVPGILTIGEGKVVREIRSSLQSLGYSVEIRILFAEEYGLPQSRRRVFIVASAADFPESGLLPVGLFGPVKRTSHSVNEFMPDWPTASGKPVVTVWDAISDLPEHAAPKYLVPALYSAEATGAFQSSARVRSCLVWNHSSHAISKAMLRRIESVPEGGNWLDIPRRLLPAGMRRARKSDHTKRYGRLDRSGLASTILTKCDPHWGAYVHPKQDRTITVREAARLQGFPDVFRFPGEKLSKHYMQIGNAVPPIVARQIGEKLADLRTRFGR